MEDKINEAVSNFLLGEKYYIEEKLFEAVEAFESVLKIEDSHTLSHYFLYMIHAKLGNPKKASFHFKISIATPGQMGTTNFDRLIEAYKQKHYKPKKRATDSKILFDQGNNYFREREFDKAIKTYKEAIEINSDNNDIYFNLGLVYFKVNRMNESIVAFRNAIKIKPDDEHIHNNLGMAYRKLERLDEAIISFNKAIGLKLDYGDAHYNLGLVYAQKENHNEAIVSFKEAIKINPKDNGAYFNLGLSYRKLELLDLAIVAYNEAIKLNPNYELAYFFLGAAYGANRQLEEARKAYKNSLRLKENNKFTHFNLGLLYKEEGNIEKARYHLKRALDLGHERAKAVLESIPSQEQIKPITKPKPKISRFENHFNKANILLDKGKIKEAVFLFKEAIPNEPNADPNTYLPKSFLNPGYVHFCLGLQYEKNGDLKKAGFHLVLAVQIGNAPAKPVYEWMNRSEDLPRAPIRKLITGQKNPEQPLIRTLSGHTDSVQACAISPDGSFVVSAAGNMMKIYGHDNDNTLRVWDFKTGAERLQLSGHLETVKGCAISKDGTLIISVSEDCMKVWEAATGKELNHIETSGFACSECTDDASIVVASLFVELIDIPSGKGQITILTDDLLHDCAISNDGSFIVTAGTDRHLVIWNAKNGEEIKYLKTPNNTNPYMDIRACSISPNDRFIVSGDEDGFLRIWDPKSVEETRVIKGHSNWITACAVSPDNTMIVSSSWDGTLKIWNVETGKNILALTGHSGAVNDCVFSTCGKYIISAGDDKTVKIWDFSTFKSK